MILKDIAEATGLGDILEDHRAQGRHFSRGEEGTLVLDDGCHRLAQGLLALMDGIDKPAGLLDLVAQEGHRLTTLTRAVTLVLVLLQQGKVGGT